MRFGARNDILSGVAAIVMLFPLSVACAAPTIPKVDQRLRNLELCNQSKLLDAQIDGCTRLINDGRQEPARILAVAHNNRGNGYSKKGDYERAIKDYDRAISLTPTYAMPFNNRGVAYKRKGEYDRAIDDFNEAIKLNPKYGHAFVNRAGVYEKRHDYERAIQDYNNAIRVEPDLSTAWNGRCWRRAIIGQLQAALTDCNKALFPELLRGECNL